MMRIDGSELATQLKTSCWRSISEGGRELIEFAQVENTYLISVYDLVNRKKEGPLEYSLLLESTGLRATEMVIRENGYGRWEHFAWVYLDPHGSLCFSRGIEVKQLVPMGIEELVSEVTMAWWGVQQGRMVG